MFLSTVRTSPWKFQLDLGGPDFIGTESGSQPPCPIRGLQNMNPQEKSKKIDSTEYGHPRLNLTAFFGQGRGGGGKFRAVPNQANQQHVQNGALRLRGIWIPKKKPNSTLGNPFCTGLSLTSSHRTQDAGTVGQNLASVQHHDLVTFWSLAIC